MQASASAPVRPVVHGSVGSTLLARRGDEHLAKLIANGNQQAFETLYERYYQQLYRYCRSILHDDTDAQDALQSAMTSALTALRESHRRAPMRPWLYRIAHNASISVIRRRQSTLDEAPEVWAGASDSTEEQADERARFALLMADLGELPERQRSALLMRELSGLSHGEIAMALQTSEGAAKQAIFDGRKALAEFQEGREMECDRVQRVVSDGDGRALRRRSVRAHLRDCVACKAFEATIGTRAAEFDAVVPLIAAPAAAALLARVLSGGAIHGAAAASMAGAGAAGSVGVGGATAGADGGGVLALGAAKTAATAIAGKVLAGVAVLAVAAGGVVGVRALTHSGTHAAVRHRAVVHQHATVAKHHRADLTRRHAPPFRHSAARAHARAVLPAVTGTSAAGQTFQGGGESRGSTGGSQPVAVSGGSDGTGSVSGTSTTRTSGGSTTSPTTTRSTSTSSGTTSTGTTTSSGTTSTRITTSTSSGATGSTRHARPGKAVGQQPGHDPGHDKTNPPAATGKGKA